MALWAPKIKNMQLNLTTFAGKCDNFEKIINVFWQKSTVAFWVESDHLLGISLVAFVTKYKNIYGSELEGPYELRT